MEQQQVPIDCRTQHAMNRASAGSLFLHQHVLATLLMVLSRLEFNSSTICFMHFEVFHY